MRPSQNLKAVHAEQITHCRIYDNENCMELYSEAGDCTAE